MNSRGRKSSAALATPVVLEARRPPPPPDLTDDQAAIWRDTVATMAAGWFNRSHTPLLVAYCRHVTRAAEIERILRRTMAAGSEATVGDVDQLLKMAERETRAITACARALRLTHQSQMHPRTAGRAIDRQPSANPPWEFS